jgi:bacillithiol system protein YtxJ
MGILESFSKTIFGSNPSSEKNSKWKGIKSEEDIEAVFKASNKKPQIVFKHSSSCGVSFFAKRSLDTPELLDNPDVDLHLINVIQNRSESFYFADKVNIQHESPQIFVLKNGEVQWHGSYASVNANNVLSNI